MPFNAESSPEHQVALVDDSGRLIAWAAEHASAPLDPLELVSKGEGFWTVAQGGEPFLARVSRDGERSVVVAESTRAVRERVRGRLWRHVAWYLGLGGVLLFAVNQVMRRAVLRPIRRIGRAVSQMEQGRLGVQVAIPDSEELAALAHRFNTMSNALAEHAESNRREMETARQVQSHLLPSRELRLGCVEIASYCQQAGPVGGDFFDVQQLPGGRVAVLVADLSGHNVAAALHTAMVRAIIRRESEQAGSPGQVLARLNMQLQQGLPDEHFATIFLGWFDPQSCRLEYANAGHPAAALRQPDGRLLELEPTCPLLGIFPTIEDSSASVELSPGSVLLLYTDGLTDLRSPEGRLWGTEEVFEFMEGFENSTPRQLIEELLGRASRFQQGRAQEDDVTIMAARYFSDRVESLEKPSGAYSNTRSQTHA